jgi:hypothetical protein
MCGGGIGWVMWAGWLAIVEEVDGLLALGDWTSRTGVLVSLPVFSFMIPYHVCSTSL